MSGQGIAHGNRELLVRIAWRVEKSFGDYQEVTDVGGGLHETRPWYRAVLQRTQLRRHPAGALHALAFLTAPARARFAVLLAAIQGRPANQRDPEEVETLTLPAELPLDATWDAAPVAPTP